MQNINSIAVIVAAGTGKRMGGTVKKQYMEIRGLPVLFYTINAFEKSKTDRIVIVTGPDETDYVRKNIVEKYGFKKVETVCAGGRERFDSVFEGLKSIKRMNRGDGGSFKFEEIKADNTETETSRKLPEQEKMNITCNESPDRSPDNEIYTDMSGEGCSDIFKITDNGSLPKDILVLVHDGVRPFVTPELINRVIDKAYETGACVTAVPEKDTVKTVENGVITKTLDRSLLYRIQTPQAFELNLLYDSYERMYEDMNSDRELKEKLTKTITDDATLVEHYQKKQVIVVDGDYRNIKITTPEDIIIAEAFINS